MVPYRLILLLLPLSVFGQNLSNNSTIIYKANGSDTVTVSFFNSTDVSREVVCESSDSVYINGFMAANVGASFVVQLNNNEVIKAKGDNAITYSVSKPFQATRDSSLIRFQTVLQNLDGFNMISGTLTNAQIRALFAVWLRKEEAITPNGTIRIKKLLKD